MQTNQSLETDEKKNLQPRDYQIKLAEFAVERNVIAFLNTGAGKTLISTLVIEQFAEEFYLKDSQRKWCIFLVPTIPLVFQVCHFVRRQTDEKQSAYIKQVTNLKVGMYFGDNKNEWKEHDWKNEFEQNQVMVMVHQIFLDLLRHAFYLISQCSLLIFDECHHTTKNHPYNMIMREFYKPDQILPPINLTDPFQRRQDRPRILGLTASPLINSNEDKTKCKQLLQELEEQLDSRIVIANQEQVNLFVTLPQEKICPYDSPAEESANLVEKCSSFQRLQELDEKDPKVCSKLRILHVGSILTSIEHIASGLGLWFCHRFVQKMIEQLQTKIPRITNLEITSATNHSHLTKKIFFLQQLQEELQVQMHQNPNQLIYPKVKMLLLLLSHYWKPNDNNNHGMRAILFVERKTTAFCLLDLLETAKKFRHSAKSAQGVDALLFAQLDLPLQPRPILEQQTRPPSPQGGDNKSRLMAFCQKKKLEDPQFQNHNSGPSHQPRFWCTVSMNGHKYEATEQEALFNVKDAQKYAAGKLLEILEHNLAVDKKQKVNHHESVFKTSEDYQIPINVDSITADVLIGHGSNDDWNFLAMDVEMQQEKVEAFRKGTINMLVSTSVGEEGLDIQPCNLVIQFDELKTVKSYIQSRGRARHPKAHFVCMIESIPQSKGIELVENAKNCEKTMRDIIASYAQIEVDSEDENDNNQVSELCLVTSKNAKLTVQSSKSLLNHYSQKLPSDVYCKLAPLYVEHNQGELYLYDIILPSNCPLEQKKVSGIPHRSKTHAKRLAAFNACVKLYEAKELDENLLPVKFIPFEDGQLSEEKKPQSLECEMMIPPPLQGKKMVEMELYQNRLQLTGNGLQVTYCVLTHSRLPDLPPFQLSNNIRVQITSSPSILALNSDQILKCLRFHQLLWDGVMQKSKDEIKKSQNTCKLENFRERFFLVVPASQEGISWSQIDSCLSSLHFPRPSQLSSELVLLTPYSHGLYCFDTQRFATDVNWHPLSPFPDPMYPTFADYYQQKHNYQICNISEPLLQVFRLSRPKNLLTTQPSFSQGHSSTSILVPELCAVHPLPQSLLVPALNLPSALYRIETLLITNDLSTYLPPIRDVELLRQAVTSKTTQEKENYERLETLGDSFLKFATSLQLFRLYPRQHEGFLSETRSKFISNNFLCKLGISQNIPEHIVNKQFSLDWWTWPTFAISDSNNNMNGLLQNHVVKRKTIADCVEAILGAFYHSEGEPAAWNLIRKWIPTLFSNLPEPNQPSSLTHQQESIVTEAQKSLRYQFKNPHILLQALTHASMSCSKQPEDYMVPCYQRLEFLGDAILDVLITKYLFATYPTLAPGELTNLRACAVNSNAFSFIAFSHKLHQFIQRISPSLDEHIESYVTSVQNSLGTYREEYDPPKVLGDVFEAVTAAIYLDLGCSLDALWDILQGVLLPFLKQYISPHQAKNPVAEIMEWIAKQKGLKSQWKKVSMEGERTTNIQLRIYKEEEQIMNLNENGEEDVLVVVGKASNKKVAKRRAAIEALQKVKNQNTDVKMVQ